MTSRDRFIILWSYFSSQAFALAIWAAWDTQVVDVALLVAFIVGVPLSLMLAVLGRRKRLLFTICLETVLIACSVGVAMLAFDGNPLVIVVLILFSAGVIWLVAPLAPVRDDFTTCSKCGYSLVGLGSSKCPECGEVVSGSGRR